ncbi:MAG: DegT/DnrJ/EryC1/StrS family aminotransferase, partial [Comamonas sp.]
MNELKESSWIPLLVPDMPSPQELLPWLERMHKARQYSNFGPLVQELEAEFSMRLDVEKEQLVTVANATLGLELVLQALDLPTDSRVLLPAFTFVATATAVIRAGHQPVLADVDASTWMLTPEIARAACERMHID